MNIKSIEISLVTQHSLFSVGGIIKVFVNARADIMLLKYSVFVFGNEKQVICSEVEVPEIYEIPERPRTIEDEMLYIKDKSVQDAFAKTIEAINLIDNKIEVGMTNSRVVFKYQGRNFASLNSRRSFFFIEWREENDWNKDKVEQFQYVQKIIEDKIMPAYESVGGKVIKKP
jgi:hypothetical protein